MCGEECRAILKRIQAKEDSRKKSAISKQRRSCKACGKIFVHPYGVKIRACSRACAVKVNKRTKRLCKKSYAARRRARMRGEKVGSFFKVHDVFVRDKWVCQLCHKRVMRTAKAPHPLSPSLDHIIPLSASGEHAWHNVQLAHLYCNSIKSDNVIGQLRLGMR